MLRRIFFFFIISLILGMASSSGSRNVAVHGGNIIFNVLDFGAAGNGVTDDSQAFLKAWDAVCTAQTASVRLMVPREKTFRLRATIFSGPCKPSRVYVQVSGVITAPEKSAWHGPGLTNWLIFKNIDGLVIYGKGTIDGQGSSWWQSLQYREELPNDVVVDDIIRPIALSFYFCNNLRINGLNVINSPSKQINLYECHRATLSNLNIKAPKHSPNTDGIVIGQSSHLRVFQNDIGTGDDCIAVLGGSFDINISSITCGPGHGISIGSLGMNGKYDTVEEIHVKNCNFTGTQNGVRIKTWQGGSGYARKISFHGITVNRVKNPIIVDQYYCPDHLHCPNKTSAVKVSDISYARVRGTSTTKTAINLSCSQSMACTNIELKRINITSATQGFVTSSYCFNAHGEASCAIPDIQCLLQ